ncbi:hypothetical protein FHG87_014424 [Trinorchestia longiramus]|nr:hypothetical protein FHG87_014424 [Trinorchestia longiramus]
MVPTKSQAKCLFTIIEESRTRKHAYTMNYDVYSKSGSDVYSKSGSDVYSKSGSDVYSKSGSDVYSKSGSNVYSKSGSDVYSKSGSSVYSKPEEARTQHLGQFSDAWSTGATSLVDWCHQLGRLVSESACEQEDPGSNPAADMVDAARNTAWDLGKQPNNYRSNYPTQEWARRLCSESQKPVEVLKTQLQSLIFVSSPSSPSSGTHSPQSASSHPIIKAATRPPSLPSFGLLHEFSRPFL